MASQVIQSSTLTSIANAIRSKTGSFAQMTPAQMASTISSSWIAPGARSVVSYSGTCGSYTNLICKFVPINNMVNGSYYDYTIDIETDSNTTTVGLFVSQGEGDAFTWLNITPGTRQTLTGTFQCEYESGYTPSDSAKNVDILAYQYPRNIDGLTKIYSLSIEPHVS